MKRELKNGVKVGFVCIFIYLISYLTRNLLSVLSPQMLAEGIYTKEAIAFFSSAYFTIYAVGQLVNGIIGDRIACKYMVLFGLVLAGGAQITVPVVNRIGVQTLCFAFMGFGLSMLRGPLVKVIVDNIVEEYARICCVLLSFVSFLGPMAAGILTICFFWRSAFLLSGILTCLVGWGGFGLLSLLERKKFITMNKVYYKAKEKNGWGIIDLFHIPDIGFYILIGMIGEIAASSIMFWIPTYIVEHLGFSLQISSILFSTISLIKSISPFLCLFLFRIFKEKDIIMIRISLLMATAFYAGMLLFPGQWGNVLLLFLAQIAVGCVAATVWSIYIPSLSKSGRVSGANGILDCSGYLAAAGANTLFASVIRIGGWECLLFTWSCLMLIGALVTFFKRAS